MDVTLPEPTIRIEAESDYLDAGRVRHRGVIRVCWDEPQPHGHGDSRSSYPESREVWIGPWHEDEPGNWRGEGKATAEAGERLASALRALLA